MIDEFFYNKFRKDNYRSFDSAGFIYKSEQEKAYHIRHPVLLIFQIGK
jgi:hypothetical protein